MIYRIQYMDRADNIYELFANYESAKNIVITLNNSEYVTQIVVTDGFVTYDCRGLGLGKLGKLVHSFMYNGGNYSK